ncbi:UDP-glucose 4-epimerase GalE [Streptomyces sp. SID8361]|uniref:UDP-glucose 4-epimerase GalE n=1 Tax=Streptomyces sp. MnatMP-M27 TaxID=1839768 RepID=UPI00081E0E30|nr:UDP-glucose 4-epimerase GalE [Streptomyces sp. MnatMP-M27]MYU18234.1 UDP-glucose 4-epimerase GalE [Streptomyces sp. SID8361]SCG12756.1 UDP-glucose 4-epimerase [Streptomyces sp. MnatMP-M27]
MRILVTGGSGYIGSHTTVQLVAAGHEVVIADDFSRSKRSVLGRLSELCGAPVECHAIDLTDREATRQLFEQGSFEAVMHFAGLKAVGESVAMPLEYYANNLGLTLSVLAAMRAAGVTRLVFSSSATVYGENASVPMRENMSTSATNPYGWTKVMQEQVLRDLALAAPDLRIALLRYFNPVGAHPSGLIGEDPHGVPNNLMPLLAQIAVGQRDHLSLFGRDYPTPDGTARRDYLHVEDLAAGHIAALNVLGSREEAVSVWNLGTGMPTSVLELVAAFAEASGRVIPTVDAPRRPGDIADSYADPSKAQTELGWKAARTIQDMCADTWRWQSQNPTGYPDE